MTNQRALTFEKAHALFRFDLNTGILFNRIDRGGNGKASAGAQAGTLHSWGYWVVYVDYRPYKVHRIIWLLNFGRWPAHEIDHIDHNRSNNCLDNLREATTTENKQNMTRRYNNSSGIVGVSWDGNNDKWQAQICVKKKRIHLGRFADFAQAVCVRKAAEVEHGFHENHGLTP